MGISGVSNNDLRESKNFHAFSYKKQLKIHIEKFLSGQ